MTDERGPIVTVEVPIELREIRPLVKEPTRQQLFLFSAATWNTHRIHYDPDYAREEGHPDVIVQSHLHASFLTEALVQTVGEKARIVRFGWQNRAVAVPGERLTCRGRATRAARSGDALRVEYELEEWNERGALCTSAWASVVFPAPA
jgi:hydroxyacyl-ACP dehydratase HTD2-like protein with hotdog domain